MLKSVKPANGDCHRMRLASLKFVLMYMHRRLCKVTVILCRHAVPLQPSSDETTEPLKGRLKDISWVQQYKSLYYLVDIKFSGPVCLYPLAAFWYIFLMQLMCIFIDLSRNEITNTKYYLRLFPVITRVSNWFVELPLDIFATVQLPINSMSTTELLVWDFPLARPQNFVTNCIQASAMRVYKRPNSTNTQVI